MAIAWFARLEPTKFTSAARTAALGLVKLKAVSTAELTQAVNTADLASSVASLASGKST